MTTMTDGTAGNVTRPTSRSAAGGVDPLAKRILLDLAIATAGFLMIVAAVVLTVDGLSPS